MEDIHSIGRSHLIMESIKGGLSGVRKPSGFSVVLPRSILDNI